MLRVKTAQSQGREVGRRRKKKEEEDEEYVPETEKKKSPKKEAVAVKVESKTDILQQAVKEATLEEVSEEMLMEDVDTKQILANHKIPDGLKIVNIEKPIVKVETPKTKLPEPKPSSVSQSLSKATITPVQLNLLSQPTPRRLPRFLLKSLRLMKSLNRFQLHHPT